MWENCLVELFILNRSFKCPLCALFLSARLSRLIAAQGDRACEM